MSKFALKVVAMAVVASFALAGQASAAQHSCAKAGYSVTFRDADNVVLTKYVPGYWEKDGSSTLVCSRAYGKAVPVGESGTTPDGPVWSTPMAMNRRYTAVVDGYGGNADGGHDTGIRVIDLKTGRQVSESSPSSAKDGYDDSISSVALNDSGGVGWIDSFYSDTKDAWQSQVYVKYPAGKKRRLADGPQIYYDFLRWSDDGKTLLWSDKLTLLSPLPAKYKPAKPSKRKSCYRDGDRAEGRDYSYIYVSRPFKADQWKGGRALIACSQTFKRRVVIARSGQRGDERFTYGEPTVTENFAAVLVRRSREDGTRIEQLASFDLSTTRRTCLASVGGDLRNARLGAVYFNGATTSWLASGTLADGSKAASLIDCVGGAVSTRFTSASLDSTYIGYDSEAMKTIVIESPSSGS